jgi:hypothetical protein
MKQLVLVGVAGMFAACTSETPQSVPAESVKVATTGKTAVPLAQVPVEVIAAANATQVGFRATEAQAETRDGRRYFDIEGTQADGSEIEFDIMEENGSWKVVETQRDIAFSAAPPAVRRASAAHDAALVPTRVIESKQADGLVLYELYAQAGTDPQGRKVEIKWDGAKAEVLGREWAH